MEKKTKIVATIGPASASKETLKKMVRAGMNVARLNFSHGTHSEFKQMIQNIRAVSKETGVNVAIMQDLQGPKIRVGNLAREGRQVRRGQQVILTILQKTSLSKNKTKQQKSKTVTISAKKNIPLIPIQYKKLPSDVKKGDRILINDGLIELRVEKSSTTEILCKVVEGGLIESHKGINVPGGSVSAKPLTAKDKKDLAFGLQQGVDFVALSFVRSAQDVEELRAIIEKKSGVRTKNLFTNVELPQIIAKIERAQAVKHLEKIMEVADGVMVARGDLGVEMPAEKVPVIQKRVIRLANLHGKPVITATEMLQSMVTSPRATRAEISDVANAVFDHTDAVMLSNESATGKYPVKAVETLSKVAVSTEEELKKRDPLLASSPLPKESTVARATCENAAELAGEINADLIVAVTLSGFTARHVAKHHEYIPLVAITENQTVARQLQLTWGVEKVLVTKIQWKNLTTQIKKLLLQNRLAKSGQRAVLVINASKGENQITTVTL